MRFDSPDANGRVEHRPSSDSSLSTPSAIPAYSLAFDDGSGQKRGLNGQFEGVPYLRLSRVEALEGYGLHPGSGSLSVSSHDP